MDETLDGVEEIVEGVDKSKLRLLEDRSFSP